MRRSLRVVVLAFAAVLIAAACQPGGNDRLRGLDRTLPQDSFKDVPVVVLVFDELPLSSLLDADMEIDAELYPNFARLAADSIWFRNTVTVATFTAEALPAIMTGAYPKQIPAAKDALYPHNLFTLLGDAYEVVAREELPRLCTERFCGRKTDIPMVPEMERLSAFAEGPRGRDLNAFLDVLDPPNGPTFYFLHLVLPHPPWRYLPTGQGYPAEQPVPGEINPPGRGTEWVDDPWLVAQAYQRHLLQLQMTDRVLGIIISRLKEMGVYRDALLVVTADHGNGFVAGYPRRLIREANIGHLAPIPFLLKRPEQTTGYVSDIPLQTIDIVPTIADVLELSNTWPDMDGVSAFSGDVTADRVRRIQSTPIDVDAADLRSAVEMKYETFGQTGGSLDLFALAQPGGEALVGRALDEFPIGGPSSVTAAVDTQPYIDAVADAPQIPARIRGVLDGEPGGPIVVAVNDRIAAVTRPYGEHRFQAMFSPEVFRRPPNSIELFVYVSGALYPIRTVAPDLED